VLVESVRELFPCLVQVFAQSEHLEHGRVPFALQELQDAGDVVCDERFRGSCLGNLKFHKVALGIQVHSCDRTLTCSCQVLLNEIPFKDMACLGGDDGVDEGLARKRASCH